MSLRKLMITTVLVGMSSIALAHAPKVGVNGGPQADAGGFHVEVVAKGNVLDVFLRDHGDKPVLTEGYKGTAIFVMEGNAQRIVLAPAGENRLSGTATVAVPSEPKGAVKITTSTGSTVQAKFN